MREKRKQKFISQEAVIVGKNDYFSTYDTIYEITQILEIGNNTNNIQIIGLFDAFGEGKSSLLKTLKEVLKEDFKNKNYCILELDLWKYENSELKNEFHKVFHNEKSNYFTSDFLAGLTFSVAEKLPLISNFYSELHNKKFIENKITDDYFAYGLQKKIRIKKEKEMCTKNKENKEPIPIVIIENMDRLTIEEKTTALSSIYNYRDSFNSHIIIAFDPDSVRKTTKYFESLIQKCFTAYMYITPKTKHSLREYIRNQLPEIKQEETKEICNYLTEMLLTQYPISLRTVNHCINTYMMSFKGEKNYSLKLFMAILQVQYHQLYRAISQNPYILKKFIHHANDSNFNGYLDYSLEKEESYKLNLLIKSLGKLNFNDLTMLSILSPLNSDFFDKKDKVALHESIVKIELFRKAKLERDVTGEIEKILKKISINEADKFLAEVIKDRETFINFFESQEFDEVLNILEELKAINDSLFLETILSYSVEGINDYSFYDNYAKTLNVFIHLLKIKRYAHLLIHRRLENFQLARKLLEKGITIEESDYFVLKLKRLSFIKKILYTTHFFEAMDSTSILTLQSIVEQSIRDLDIKKFETIERFKQKSIENFYFEAIPTDRYEFATVDLILDIIESELFERLNSSKKVKFYQMIFENSELIENDNFYLVIQKFSLLLNESFFIADIDTIIEILQKIKILDSNLSNIHPLVLQKFIEDNCEIFGKYDEDLNHKLNLLIEKTL